jgi:hypothetical protein
MENQIVRRVECLFVLTGQLELRLKTAVSCARRFSAP